MKPGRLLLYLSLLVSLLCQTAGHAQSPAPVVRYKLDRDAGGTYRVFMTSAQSFTGTGARITTAQVTLRVPGGTFPNLKTSTITSYSGTGYTTLPNGTTTATGSISNWKRGARVNAPSESTAYDYLSFSFQSSDDDQTFDIPANLEILLFSFTDNGVCPGPVELLSDTDPFNPRPAQVNSAGTNPGNQMSILGFGTGAYLGILGGATVCPGVDLALLFGVVPPLTVGQTASLPVSVSNVGGGLVTGPFTVTITLPTNFSAPPAFGINTFSCSTVGQQITCVDPNASGLAVGGVRLLVLPVKPALAAAGSSPTFTGTVSSTNTEQSITNNTSSVTATQPVAGIPDLTTSVGPVPALTVGVASQLPVTITNIGSGTATGPLVFTTTLPTSVTAPPAFTGNGFSCTTTGQSVSCVSPNPAGLTPTASTTFNIPITPLPGTAGQTPTFTGTTQPVPGESTTANNTTTATGQPITLSPIPDLVVSVGPVPPLTAGQTSTIPVSVSNIGTGPTTGPTTLTLTLPTNTTSPAQFTDGPWSCTTTGSLVSCTDPASLTNDGVTTLTVPVTPGLTTAGITPVFTATAATPGESTTTNNGGTGQPTQPVAGIPDLVTALGPVPSLTVGQTSQLPVTITNVGSGTATGPLVVTTTLPTSVTAPPAFTGNGFSCTTTGQSVSCVSPNPAGLTPTASTTFNIPITPLPGTAGQTPTFTGTTQPVPGESTTANNTTSLTATSPVQAIDAPDLTIAALPPAPNFVANQTSILSVTVTNGGNSVASAPLTVQLALPAGLTVNSGQLPASYTITDQIVNSSGGFTYTITGNAVSLTAGQAVVIGVPITPSVPNIGQTFVFGLLVFPAAGETDLGNNTGLVTTTVPVQPTPVPDLAVIIPAQSFTLTAGLTSTITVGLTNVGTAASVGSVTVTFAMPAGFSTSPTAFTTAGFSCALTSTSVVCVGLTGMAVSSSVTLSIPVLPTVAGSVNPGFQVLVTPAQSETNLSNNLRTINYSGTVQANGFTLALKALLQGPYDPATGLMRDDLRRRNLIPAVQPYGSLSGSPAFVLINSGTETVSQSVLSGTGSNAIVDWVLVELRSAANPTTILATKPALLQADGDVVSSVDGLSAVPFAGLVAGQYYVAIRHRNHLGVMSAQSLTVASGVNAFDFTDPTHAYRLAGAGNYPQYVGPGNVAQLWAGNTNGDAQVIFQGPDSDADPAFFAVVGDEINTGRLTNFIHTGYDVTDVNLDGDTIFQGPGNELDMIFFNIVDHPENTSRLANFIIQQQLP